MYSNKPKLKNKEQKKTFKLSGGIISSYHKSTIHGMLSHFVNFLSIFDLFY